MAPTLPSASKLLDDADVLVALPGGVGPGLFMITMSTHDYSGKHLFMSMITLKLIYS